MKQMRIHDIVEESIVDGPGIRLTIFFQGCSRRCPGCHNPDTHDPKGGRPGSVSEIMRKLDSNPLITGVTFSGGDPVDQWKSLDFLLDTLIKREYDLILYTGHTINELADMARDKKFGDFLISFDYIISEPFIMAQKCETIKFRGSSNQKVWVPHVRGTNHIAFTDVTETWDQTNGTMQLSSY